MATAREERAAALAGRGCLGKAAPDEPVFILRGQDIFAPQIVEYWAQLVESYQGAISPKTIEAREIARDMRAWLPRRHPD